MSSTNYYNKNENPLYVLHFPGTGYAAYKEKVIDNEIDRVITISDNLSIISIMNKECWNMSPLRQQCEHNNIKLYNSAMNEAVWNNTLKIAYILQCLDEITTDYVLILDGRDTIIVNDLDNNFLDKFKELNSDIVYNGTPLAYPKKYVESLQDLVKIKGKQKYLNAGVCVGKRETLKDFYTKVSLINQEYPENKSEQFIIRLCRKTINDESVVTHDSENDIFRIVHHADSIFKNLGNDKVMII